MLSIEEISSTIRTMEELSKNAHRFEHCGNRVVPADDIDKALEIVRRVAAGEYKPVIHAHWEVDEFGHKCSACGEYVNDDTYENECLTHCLNCGALMDGKDDSHED